MSVRPRLHLPSIVGRTRSDPGPLLLMGLVVALTTALTAAVGPVMARTSDRALADAVRDGAPRSAVVATVLPPPVYGDVRTRDPRAVAKVRKDAAQARRLLPERVAAVLEPGSTSITTPTMKLLGRGPGNYLSLAYLGGADSPPQVSYTAGRAPRGTVGGDRAAIQIPADSPPWPVEVAVSQPTATALHLTPGDLLDATDDEGRPVSARVSGVFVAADPDDPAWLASPHLLRPAQGDVSGVPQVVAAALVPAAALPDLRLGVPSSDQFEHISFAPRPEALRWEDSAELVRAIASLKSAAGLDEGRLSWDSSLDGIVADERTQVAAARGQADVLLVALLMSAFLVLWQAAGLVVHRRSRAVVLTRERGATLVGIGSELFVEAAGFALGGAAIGLLCTWLAVGAAGWVWWLPVPVVAASAAAILGAALASQATDPRRVPANRTARRGLARSRLLLRVLVVAAIVAGAALSYVALRQRGVLGEGDVGSSPTAASAPTWWIVAGAVLVTALVPVLARLLIDATRRTSGSVAFLTAARLRATSTRVFPLLVVTVTVAQLTFAVALASTERRGQEAGALLNVGGDARVTVAAGRSASDLARTVAAEPGVDTAVAAHVEDGLRATSPGRSDSVLFVVVDAAAYARLLAASALPDATRLSRLDDGDGVPALLFGAGSGLGDNLTVRGPDGEAIALDVVGPAPRVDGSADPVLLVDAARYAKAGGIAQPNTVWAVGPGAAAAVRAHADRGDTVELYADALAAQRSAPLPVGLLHLALASSALLLLLAVLAVVMGAAVESGPRAESVGRLRSLGLRDRQLRAVLAGELVTPVLIGTVGGLALGLSAAVVMFGQLSLERITGQVSPPDVSLTPWVLISAAVLVVTALVLSQVEWARLRRVRLGQLIRGASWR